MHSDLTELRPCMSVASKMCGSLVLVVCVLLTAAFACEPPDCDNPDCGTCGNACCMMEFKLAVDPDEVYATVLSSLKAGGADGRYKYVNSTDLRQFKLLGGVQYTLQAVHTTSKYHYNDTMNMIVASNSSSVTILKGFSISQIEGAYCDEGQNYKNLVGFVKGLAQLFAQMTVFGCPGTSL